MKLQKKSAPLTLLIICAIPLSSKGMETSLKKQRIENYQQLYIKGMRLLQSTSQSDLVEAATIMRELALSNDNFHIKAGAQYLFGIMVLRGIGTQQEQINGRTLLEWAALQNDNRSAKACALYALGEYYCDTGSKTIGSLYLLLAVAQKDNAVACAHAITKLRSAISDPLN